MTREEAPKKIIVGSRNPVKVEATLAGFRRMFPGASFEIKGTSAESFVRNQPQDDSETLQGANNRALSCRAQFPESDYWVGIEGGIHEDQGELLAFAWVVIYSVHCAGKGRTGTFALPTAIAQLVRDGLELGEADDLVFARTNSKQDNGAVGLLTDNVIDRKSLYEQAVILALIPFKNQKLYFCSE
jgi:inosine/xanthosine triphosphatase